MKLLCSQCGKDVSNEFEPQTYVGDKLIVRAWIECPECVEKDNSIDADEMKNKLERYAYFVSMEVGVGKSRRNEMCLAFPQSSWEKLWKFDIDKSRHNNL